MQSPKDEIIIASDTQRDGIGIELYRNGKLIVEIFRADTEKTRTVTVFNKSIPLKLMKKAIETFEREIPLEFID
jgi:hypothetical protein